jgi:hypothetical protein
VDASVNDTLRGANPSLGLLLENAAIGAAAAARLGITIKQKTTKNNFVKRDIISPFSGMYPRYYNAPVLHGNTIIIQRLFLQSLFMWMESPCTLERYKPTVVSIFIN